MPRTRLSLALVCKEGFEGLAGRMYTEVELRAVWSMNAAFPTRISDVRSEIMKGIDARSAGVTDEQQRQDLYLNGIRVIDITGQLPAIAATRVCRNLLDMYPTARSVRWGNGRPTRLDMPPEDKPQARYVIDRIIRPPTYYPLADEGDDDDDTEGDFQETEHEDWAVAADEMVGSWTAELYNYWTHHDHDFLIQRGSSRLWRDAISRATSSLSRHFTAFALDGCESYDYETEHVDMFLMHLQNRTINNFSQYRSVSIHAMDHIEGIPEWCGPLALYNPALVVLSISTCMGMVMEPRSFESELLSVNWSTFGNLRELTVHMDLHFRHRQDERTGYSIRPEMSTTSHLLRMSPLQSSGRDMAKMLTAVRPAPKLESFRLVLNLENFMPSLPRFSAIAQAMVAIGGQGCVYTVAMNDSVDMDRLGGLAQSLVDLMQGEIAVLTHTAEPGWRKVEK